MKRECPHCHGNLSQYEDPSAVKIISDLEAKVHRLNQIPLARRQLPDGTVPVNTEACAKGWHEWYEIMRENNSDLKGEIDKLKERLSRAGGALPVYPEILEILDTAALRGKEDAK